MTEESCWSLMGSRFNAMDHPARCTEKAQFHLQLPASSPAISLLPQVGVQAQR